MNILDHLNDSTFFGPGTDIIVSLTAVLILLFAVNSNLHQQQMNSIKKEHQAQVDQLIQSYKEIGDRLKKVEDIPDAEKKIAVVVDINHDLYEQLVDAKRETDQLLARFETFLNSQQFKNRPQFERTENRVGNLDLRKVRNNQIGIVNEIARRYHTDPKKKGKNSYVISIDGYNREDIVVRNEVTLQTFTFGNHILFDMDEIGLKPAGKEILENIGSIFKAKLPNIREIQIQGHADPQSSKKYDSNLQLAANRAITVFHLFQNEVGINPVKNIMSVTSFGEYMPVQRSHYDQTYNPFKLSTDNNSEKKRTRNRRIEIVLLYHFLSS